MTFEFSLQTAILGALGSSAILAATLGYLWRIDSSRRALLFWCLAFVAQSLRLAAQLGVTMGISALWFVTDVLFAVVTLFIWLGTCALSGHRSRYRFLAGLLALALLWNFLASRQELSFLARTLPLYGIATAVMLQAAASLFLLARTLPGIGYRGLGILFGLLGLHYLDYPFLRTVDWFAPIGFSLAATLMLCMGIAMLFITLRRQHVELVDAASRLQQESFERRETEYRYQTLVDELDEGIIVVGCNDQVITANPSASRMLDVPLDELRGSAIRARPLSLFCEDGSALAETDYPLYRALRNGTPCAAEIYRLIRGDGRSLWLTINAHPLVRDGEVLPYAAIVSFSDVSERKVAERNLLASELRFRSIFEAVSGIAVQGYDPSRNVIYWNRTSEQFYGYSRDEALGRKIDDLIVHSNDAENFRRDLDRSVARGQAPEAGECSAKRRDGSLLSVYSTQVLISNLAGDPEIYRIDIDLSDIQRLQQEVQEFSERFRAIAESSELGVVVTDKAANFVYCNPRYLTLVDSTMEEIHSGAWITHLHPDDREPMRQRWRNAVATHTGFSMERRVILGDGGLIWANAHIVPIHSLQGEFRGFVATVEDITARKNAEEALRRNEEKFRATFDQAFQFIGLMNTDGILLDANRTALAFAGIAPEDVIGKPFAESPWWHEPEAREKLLNAIALASNGELVRFETTHTDHKGVRHYIDFSLKPVIDSTGKVQLLIPEGRDITPLKAAEAALRASEARFSGAFHASLDYITISRLDTGEIIDVNEAFERITGWTRDYAIGRTSSDLGIWVSSTCRQEAIDKLKREGYLREYPMQLGTKSGAALECVLNASLINVGESQLLLGVVRDVTAQRRAEEILRQSEENLSHIVHYSPASLVITDAETGRIIDFNLAWQALLGYTREQVIGKTSLEFGLWADEADRARLYQELADNGGQIDRFECCYRRADGSLLYVLNSGRQFDIGGRPSYLWSVTDITPRHELEERMAALNSELEERVEARTEELRHAQDELIRAEKLAALGALVAGVAHELNTPIGNSVMVASTLHEKTVDFLALVADGALKRSSLNTYLEAAETASDLLLRSLSQARNLVASFKQVAVDQTSDQRRRFDLREVVVEILTTLSPTLRKTPFTISIDIPEHVVMDSFPGAFGQVITNFVTNALLHAFDGRSAGTIAIRAELSGKDQLVMTVSDDGIGIGDEDLRRIFDPFFTTKLGKGGSGLGLNIVYNIVNRVLGGKISVESCLGMGTTFMLTMPLCAPGSINNNDSQKQG
ncbi:MAG: PAS domain S-box protein [Betaproteobacteria bacterium]|nr:PAS domain S-box protein [Betaproteobacteria bacterium]